jgi:hypothetical protein
VAGLCRRRSRQIAAIVCRRIPDEGVGDDVATLREIEALLQRG